MGIEVFIVGLFIAAAASLLGVFIILRRLALVSDVLSHVALPGVGVAMLAGINPFIGAFAALLCAVIGISFMERRFSFPVETAVGVLFTLALAGGMLLVPSEELWEALFGSIEDIDAADVAFTVAVAAMLIALTLFYFRRFTRVTFSRELAKESTAAAARKTELVFLTAVTLAIALGIKVVGTLLMGALVILPAVAAKNVAWSLKSMAVFAVALGIVMFTAGIAFAALFSVPPGAAIILSGGALFLVSLAPPFFRR